jgi:hypothetical protein
MKKIANRLLRKLVVVYTWRHYLHDFFTPLFRKKSEFKVFCIGYVKTGTTSLHKALKILGYRTVKIPYINLYWKNKFDKYIIKLQNSSYDAFCDFPIGYKDLYKQIDKSIPNSKFILTIRDKNSFGMSFENYFKSSLVWNPDYTILTEEILNEAEKRNNEIINYFKEKPNQLLILNIINGEGWKELCTFLKKEIPNFPFPHKNIGKYRKK